MYFGCDVVIIVVLSRGRSYDITGKLYIGSFARFLSLLGFSLTDTTYGSTQSQVHR